LFGVPPGDYYIGATPRPPSAIAAIAGGDRSAKTFHPAAVDVSRATKITIHGGEDIRNIDVAIQTQQTFKISGTVGTTLAAAAPPPTAQGAFAVIAQNQNATIQMMLSSRDLINPDVGGSRGVTVPVTPSGPGTFEIPNVMPGSYDLLALFNTNSASPAIARTVVDVRNENVSGLALRIRAGAQIKGSITVDGTTPKPGTVRIVVFTPADALKRVGVAMLATIDDNGSFTTPGAPDGRYRVPFNGVSMPPEFYVDDVRQGGVSIFDSGFEVRGRDPEPIQVLIKSGSGSLDGTVQDGSGRPLSGGVVALVPARRENEALYHSSRSDSNGGFTLRGIAPGDYKLFAWDAVPGTAHFNAAFLEKYEERGIPITIAAGAKLTQKITSIPR
jgi:hypothetical protein